MIRIEEIEITEFRGIRKLPLSLAKKNFGICGPNGTGKSGIVDAIEFALTGNITRLSGAGTAELSVSAHAPHVDSSKTPGKCGVKITAHVPSLSKTITIERTVKGASAPTLVPDDAKTQALLAQFATHPEFALSRREIVKYILTPAGERSKDVQALLRLDQIEKVRMSLQRVANDAKKDSQRATTEDDRARQALMQHLGLSTVKPADILVPINQRRALLKLDSLAELTATTSLKEGIVADENKGAAKPRVSKPTALSEVAAYQQQLAAAEEAAIAKNRQDALALLAELVADPAALKSFRRKILIEQGLALLDEDGCPLCDTAWDMAELAAHLQDKVAKASEASAVLKQLSDAVQPIINSLEDVERSAKKIVQMCGLAEPKIESAALTEFIAACEKDRRAIEKVCTDPEGIAEALAALQRTSVAPTPAADAATASLKAYVDALPDPSKEEAAKDFLVVAQERYERCQATKAEAEAAAKGSTLATKVFEHYGTVSTTVLEGIYDTVQKDFTEYYSFINRDDEDEFEGKLTPSVGKLAFDVDFYGRGKFPPGAYHSEGHQDGMGLCLYLALMKHTLGDQFTLAVLDDVLMSVDAGHRREVCSLLKSKFPKTQFILTTHDPVWLQFMRTENLIQSSVSFGGWTVDAGPQVWTESDVWKQIADKLAKNDVAGASATLRRYLEYVATILADNLRASVEYHCNGHYDFGDLWGPVIRAWKDRLQEAYDSAVSWGHGVADIEARRTEAKQKIAATQSEQWVINKALHYNEWANLQPKDFAAVAAAYQALLASMRCTNPECLELVCVSPSKGEREALRCGCDSVNLNLRLKKGNQKPSQ